MDKEYLEFQSSDPKVVAAAFVAFFPTFSQQKRGSLDTFLTDIQNRFQGKIITARVLADACDGQYQLRNVTHHIRSEKHRRSFCVTRLDNGALEATLVVPPQSQILLVPPLQEILAMAGDMEILHMSVEHSVTGLLDEWGAPHVKAAAEEAATEQVPVATT